MDSRNISNSSSLDQMQSAEMLRLLRIRVNALIVDYLCDINLHQAAGVVASATMTPLPGGNPPNKLLELVAKGFAAENDEPLRRVSSAAGYGSIPAPRPISADFSFFSTALDIKGSSKNFPKHETRYISEHKSIARCARFSSDGRFLATPSTDVTIKLFEVLKVKQMWQSDSRDGPRMPVVRTFYDYTQSINDLDFHPKHAVVVSGAKDRTIKFFDFSGPVSTRAVKILKDTQDVTSLSIHPSGDCLLAGTVHSVPHLYDFHTFQCHMPLNFQDNIVNGAINQVRYSRSGGMFVTASKDGAIRLWDYASGKCVRSIVGAHGKVEATSANFTKDQRYVLSCGKDSFVNLWEVGTGKLAKQYLGAVHTKSQFQAVFNHTEEFVLSIDESSNEIVVWDALTAKIVCRFPSNHVGVPRWIEHSPTEAAFVSCGIDESVQFWRGLP